MLLAVPFLIPAQTCGVASTRFTVRRAEGHTELLGDLLLRCSGPNAGFVPTPIGLPIPRVTLQKTLLWVDRDPSDSVLVHGSGGNELTRPVGVAVTNKYFVLPSVVNRHESSSVELILPLSSEKVRETR